MTRYVAEATRARGRDIGLVLLKAEPKRGRARGIATQSRMQRHVMMMMIVGVAVLLLLQLAAGYDASASTAASSVHQRAPVVGQREDLNLEESATGRRLDFFLLI